MVTSSALTFRDKITGVSQQDCLSKHFYLHRNGGASSINVELLGSFVTYVQVFYHYSVENASEEERTKYLKNSYSIFVNLLVNQEGSFREEVICAVLDNLTRPNTRTNYFVNVLKFVFLKREEQELAEHMFKCILQRFIKEGPHPWGLIYLAYSVIEDEAIGLEDFEFYRSNKSFIKDRLASVFALI